MTSRKGLDRLNLRLHINEAHDFEVNADPFEEEIRLLHNDPDLRSTQDQRKIYHYLDSHIHLRLLCYYLGLKKEHGISVLAKTAVLEEYEFQRTAVVSAGDPASHFYIILEGSVKILVPFQDHISLATERVLHPGETFGEIGLLNGARTRTAGIRK